MDQERNEGHIYYIPFLPVVDCLECRESMRGERKREYAVDEKKLWNRSIVEADIRARQYLWEAAGRFTGKNCRMLTTGRKCGKAGHREEGREEKRAKSR